MGKNKKTQQPMLGRTIIKDRFRGRSKDCSGKQNYLHTSELNDGYDWGRLNLQSVTEQSNLEDFLTTAELAGTEFTAEKLNIKFVDPTGNIGILSLEEKARVQQAQQKHRKLLQIPRRPKWNERTTAQELESLEKESFLQWRKQLANLQEEEHIVMTPFEKNLDFWRQLWRVIERSDIIVQIVDGRNPLLFHCSDLEDYVSEVSKSKVNLLLVNKADYLSENQREKWFEYFSERGIKVAFWSALQETEKQNEEAQKENEVQEMNKRNQAENELKNDLESLETDTTSSISDLQINQQSDTLDSKTLMKPEDTSACVQNMDSVCDLDTVTDVKNMVSTNETDTSEKPLNNDICDQPHSECIQNSSALLSGQELLDLFRTLHTGPCHTDDTLTVGMVGYPNVGKSSTINAILQTKKVPVSATPGRTKHFQTLFVEPTLMLCDCPGLVFPSFVSTKAELVVNGILPVDQMRDHISPVNLICERISRRVLEMVYGIMIRKPPEGEDPERRPNAYELLNAYGAMRGYMTARGAPDGPRSSRYILKDYVNGKILYCHAPPGITSEDFQEIPVIKKSQTVISITPESTDTSNVKRHAPVSSSIDKDFFAKMYPASHMKGIKCIRVAGRPDLSMPQGSNQSINTVGEKPWKHHNNRNKKEKLRRVYSHLDEHDIY